MSLSFRGAHYQISLSFEQTNAGCLLLSVFMLSLINHLLALAHMQSILSMQK